MQTLRGSHTLRCHHFINRDFFKRNNQGFTGWPHKLNRQGSTRCAGYHGKATLLHTERLQYKSITCWPQSNLVIGFSINSHQLSRQSLSGIADDKEQYHISSQWDAMFQQLKEYKAKHGDTLVPATYPENPSLGNWVDNNRQAYRMRFEYENSSPVGDAKNPNSKWRNFIKMMTDEKIEGMLSLYCFHLISNNIVKLLTLLD